MSKKNSEISFIKKDSPNIVLPSGLYVVNCYECNKGFDMSKSTTFPECKCPNGFVLYACAGCEKPLTKK